MFDTIVSPQRLSYMEQNHQSFSLTGRKMYVSVFFSDIVILSRNGRMDKYGGV